MTVLILGLVLFLLPHSVRMLADGWRTRTLARVGRGTYMGIYSLVSLVGLGLVIYGFGLARQQPVQVWSPPAGMRHVAALLTLLAFVLIAAAYVPGNQIKARLHHPMAHLLLFGAFLAWGVWNFVASRRRDRLTGVSYPAGNTNATVITLVAGLGAWVLTAFVLHGWLIGVRPVG
jgi:uncharacterized membrane protein